MPVPFDTILKHLKEYDINANSTPPVLIHGGERYPIDLSQRQRFNSQIVLVVHEFEEREGSDVVERVKHYQEEHLGTKCLLYRYDELAEVEAVLDDFSGEYNTFLDKGKIIRRTQRPQRDTYFYLFVAVLKLPYFE